MLHVFLLVGEKTILTTFIIGLLIFHAKFVLRILQTSITLELYFVLTCSEFDNKIRSLGHNSFQHNHSLLPYFTQNMGHVDHIQKVMLNYTYESSELWHINFIH